MDKKIFAILLLFFAIISIASVNAVNLTAEKDFDGLFSMKIVEGDNYTHVGEPNDYSTLLGAKVAYKNMNDSVFVLVFTDNVQQSLVYLTQDSGANGVKEDNLILFNATPEMEKIIDAASSQYKIDGLKDKINTFAGTSSGDTQDDLTVFIAGNNATLVKEYAKTIEFNK
ncbi:hypothetical protein [Methanobrevibacter sp.]|uniref:hypothetical protein n=1 Tax=Methanobrevibacter sp. TaxID=66852 RepID=UPI00386B35AE